MKTIFNENKNLEIEDIYYTAKAYFEEVLKIFIMDISITIND